MGSILGHHWGVTGVSLGCHWGITGVLLEYYWGITGVLLGYYWGITGVLLVFWRPKTFPSRPPERVLEKSPQNYALLHPVCKAKVSSRLDGSTVFIVSPGPLLASILEPFWHPVGSHELHYFFERGSRTHT